MKTTEMFNKKVVLSFEVFPPKLDAPIGTIYKTLDGMKGLEPDFISVTYGALAFSRVCGIFENKI